MTEVKMSKRVLNYLKEREYRSILITLESACSCGGSNITGLQVEFERKRIGEKPGYNHMLAEGLNLLVDKKLKCKSRVAIYLNESGIGNILDIEGIEL